MRTFLGYKRTANITRFVGEYFFLSNFYQSVIEWKGIKYMSAEHAYQAEKTDDLTIKQQFAKMLSPSDAKKLGRKIDLRPGWDDIRASVMDEIVRVKFENEYLQACLLDTGEALLIEGNEWHDNFYGDCGYNLYGYFVGCRKCGKPYGKDDYQKGQNHLGRILMQLRAELQKKLLRH